MLVNPTFILSVVIVAKSVLNNEVKKYLLVIPTFKSSLVFEVKYSIPLILYVKPVAILTPVESIVPNLTLELD